MIQIARARRTPYAPFQASLFSVGEVVNVNSGAVI